MASTTEIKLPFAQRFMSSASVNCKEPIIFHYTGAAGALGILSSGELWCSLASHMNDKQECLYAHQVALGIAYQTLSKSTESLRAKFIAEIKSQLERISPFPKQRTFSVSGVGTLVLRAIQLGFL